MMTIPESVGIAWMALLAWLVYATLCSARWLRRAPRSRFRFAKIFVFIVFGISGWTAFALFSAIVVSGLIPIEADTSATLRALRALEWRIRMLNLVALIAGFASVLLSVLFHEALLAPIGALWGRIRQEGNKARIAAYLTIGLTGLTAVSAWAWHLWSRDPFERWSYQLIHDPRPEVRNQAFNKIALSRPRPDPEPMIALMTQAMRDPDPKVRMGAILYAPYIGEISSAAIPDVIKAARDPNASVRVSAIHSLGTWLQKQSNEDTDQIVPVLLAALRDESSGVRLCAEKMISRARAAGIAIPDAEVSGVGENEGPASP